MMVFEIFNYSNNVYISNFAKRIKLSELEEYLRAVEKVKIEK